MSKRSKRYKLQKKDIKLEKEYNISEGLKIFKSHSNLKFDETLEIAVNLGVDPKHADQIVRGVVSLPSGTGKKYKIAVFAKEELAKEAKEAGADYVGQEDLAEKFEKEKIAVDKVIATPDMMAVVGKLGKVLGPKGLMPNPKLGTVTKDVGKTITDIKTGLIEFKADKTGIVHLNFGKVSFSEQELQENLIAVFDSIEKNKPSGVKGRYFKSFNICTTMSPALNLELASFRKV